MDIKNMTAFGIGLVFIVLVLGSVLMPALYAPTQRATATSTNSTALSLLANTTTNRTFDVTTPYTSGSGTMTITFVKNATFTGTRLYTKAGVLIDTFVNTSATSAYVTIPAGSLDTATTIQTYGFRNWQNATEQVNISSMELTYSQQSDADIGGWNSAVITLLFVVAIALVVLAIMMVMP